MLGVCRKETPYANVKKIGMVGHIDYTITQIGFGRDRPSRFGVARHQISPLPIDFVHRPYNTAPVTAGERDVELQLYVVCKFNCKLY